MRGKKKQADSTSKGARAVKSIAAKVAAAKRKEDRAAKQLKGDFGKRGNWQACTWRFFRLVVDKLKESAWFEETGNHKRQGQWPAFAYGVIQPSKDPVHFFLLSGCIEIREPHELTPQDFALPDWLIWDPELRWPSRYPDGHSCCLFHPGKTSCVTLNGYTDYVRRCFGPRGNVALIGRRYLCNIRKDEKKEPFTFVSYNPGVVNQAPDYVQGYWRENGFKLSK